MYRLHDLTMRYAKRERKLKSVTNHDDSSGSLFIGKGAVVQAEYISPELPKFSNNPCILALPIINTRKQAITVMQRFPYYSSDPRKLPPHLRTHMVMDLLHFFQPLPIHLRLEGMVSRMIRDGYLARNPVDPAYRGNIKERLACFKEGRSLDSKFEPTASGFSIVGMSGVGKSTGVKRVLSLYPQVILHNYFKDRSFTVVQIVWLKLECPKDGSITSLCSDFFKAVDDLLGTNYASIYGRKGRNIQELMLFMAFIAAEHYIGTVVIDEVQDLSVAKSGGASQLLNFFVRLVNTIGLPIVLIGTYKAIPIMSSEFRLARRGSGQGDIAWDRMSLDEDWQLFVETLWDLQYVKKKCPLTKQLSKALHEISYGVTDVAIRIYLAAQVRAIETGHDEITEALLRSAYRDDFRLVSHILETLKSGDITPLQYLTDVLPPAIQSIHTECQSEINSSSEVHQNPTMGEQRQQEYKSNNRTIKPTVSGRDNIVIKNAPARKRSHKKVKPIYNEGDLRKIVTEGKQANQSANAYQTLLEAGYISATIEDME